MADYVQQKILEAIDAWHASSTPERRAYLEEMLERTLRKMPERYQVTDAAAAVVAAHREWFQARQLSRLPAIERSVDGDLEIAELMSRAEMRVASAMRRLIRALEALATEATAGR